MPANGLHWMFQAGQASGSLGPGQALDVGRGAFIGQWGFIDGGTDDAERHTDLGQQFTTTGRAGGQV
ncbi:hypothetical protein D3C71_1692210 [compost metagenome]